VRGGVLGRIQSSRFVGSFAVMKCAKLIYLQDADINELCSEFTSKARCDGTKVVLEPQGVHSILESLSKKH